MLRCTVVQFLYTHDFMVIVPFITWGALASIPKAVSWCMAFTIISKGDGRTYILTEVLDAIISVPLCYFAYIAYGLEGLGIAYIIWYLIYALITGIVYYGRYRMTLYRSTLFLSIVSLTICTGAIRVMDYLPAYASYPLLLLAAVGFIPPLRRMLRR